MFADERLSATNPSLFDSVEQYITEILLNGSVVQRNAVLDAVGKNSDLSMPEVKYMGAEGISLIRKYIIESCQVLGCDFKGDLPAVASMLFDDYGGMTLLEWARFFQMVSKGEFRDEYQSMNTRGLNAEFLRDWIEKYDTTRGDTVQRLRKELPLPSEQREPENAPTLEQIRQHQRDAVALDALVNDWRVKYEHNLTVRRVERVRDERKGADGKMVVYEYDTPIIEDKDGAAYTRLFDFLSVFYGFTGADIKGAIVGLTAMWELERVIFEADMAREPIAGGDAPERKPTEPAAFYRTRSKILLNQLRRFVLDIHREILCAGLQKVEASNHTTAEFFTAITGKSYKGDKGHVPIEPHLQEVATQLIREFHAGYGTDARAQLDAGAFVLYRNEYVAFRCIYHAVTVGGIEHPFTKILNIEQQ